MRMFSLFLLTAMSATTRADEVWLQPERLAAPPGAVLDIKLRRLAGEEPSNVEITSEHVTRGVARLGGQDVYLISEAAAANELAFSLTLPRPGVAVVALELKPQYRDVADGDVERRLRAIYAGDALRSEWEATPKPRKWRESHVEVAKTFVRVGEPPVDDRTWSEPLGLAIEMVPQRDPTALRVGDHFGLRMVRAGVPLAGCVVEFVSVNESHEHVLVTDENGRVSAPLDIGGVWRLRAIELKRASAPDRVWDGALATMMIHVQ